MSVCVGFAIGRIGLGYTVLVDVDPTGRLSGYAVALYRYSGCKLFPKD